MRKYFLNLFCLLSALLITSCEKEQLPLEEINQDISPFSKEQFRFSLSEKRQVLTLYNNGYNLYFNFRRVPEWLTIKDDEGENLGNRGYFNTFYTENMVLEADPLVAGYGISSAEIEVDYYYSSSSWSWDRVTEEKTSIIKITIEGVSAPKVTTSEAENITGTSLDVKGQVVLTGGCPVEEYGHCWSVNKDPELAVKCPQQEVCDTTKSFVSSIEGLLPATPYYVWAYARNELGTGYSEPTILTTTLPDGYKWNGEKAESFAEGDGSETNPYIIKTGEQLSLMSDYTDGYYFKLANDIDLDNRNWMPIPTFKGKLDGNGHTISNLRIERDDVSNCGLIGTMTGSDLTSIKNLTIRGVYIKGDYACAGAIVGLMDAGSITNCKVIFDEKSELRGKARVGGIVGSCAYNYNSSGHHIEGCTVETTTSDDRYHILGTDNVGGIVGTDKSSYNSTSLHLSNCHVLGCNIIGTNYVGGIAGASSLSSNSFSNCEYQGTLDGYRYVGGITGGRGRITASKVVANIHCEADNAGGLSVSSGDYVVACYVDGTITCSNRNAETLYGMTAPRNITFSYSTMQCDHSGFNPLGINGAYSYSIYDDDIDKIKQIYEDSYDDKIDYWNFNNTWTWTGVVNGKQKSVVLPRLAWE